MAKARMGLYAVKGDTLTRTHEFCPKCGPGVFLASHTGKGEKVPRRSCGKCGYSEIERRKSKTPERAAS
jgi:small subunit ribosomal protein S27Ae